MIVVFLVMLPVLLAGDVGSYSDGVVVPLLSNPLHYRAFALLPLQPDFRTWVTQPTS